MQCHCGHTYLGDRMISAAGVLLPGLTSLLAWGCSRVLVVCHVGHWCHE